jgi:hypothetical protein
MPVVAVDASLAEGEDFGVGGGVLVLFAAVGGGCDDLVVGIDDHGSDGHVACGSGSFGELEGVQHPVAVAVVFGVIEGGIGDVVWHDRFWDGRSSYYGMVGSIDCGD